MDFTCHPVIDKSVMAGLLSFTDGPELADLVTKFITAGRERTIRMDDLGRNDTWDELRREAHSMISLAGNLGLRQVQHIATAMEICLINGEQVNATRLLQSMCAIAPAAWNAAEEYGRSLTGAPS